MPRADETSIWEAMTGAGLAGRFLHSHSHSLPMAALAGGNAIGGGADRLKGRSVLVAAAEQLAAALAFIELDGIVRRVTVCPPGFPDAHLPEICKKAEIDAIVTDRDASCFSGTGGLEIVPCGANLSSNFIPRASHCVTEWVLFTSGTTGLPKLAAHSLAALTGAIGRGAALQEPHVWATFYDIRRYGGLQIFLRAMFGNASLVLSSPDEPVADHLARLKRHRVTHISGTPSHWRRVLMSPAAAGFSPRTVRLSGEIADQAVLDGLRGMFPSASIGHAYASTEAGVGFEVSDGLEGFPAGYVESGFGDVEMRVEEGCLLLRSKRTARRYIGEEGRALAREDGFVNTGDMVELRGSRYYFTGRRDGVINVGGQKVHPEEVETVINRHPSVAASLVKTQRNSIIGAVVVADVVLTPAEPQSLGAERRAVLQREILDSCRAQLPSHKVPALIRFLPALTLTSGGKLARTNA
ncbi:MAG: ANL family adenylate-forming protein [Rhodomicrobium sp.]